MTIHSLLTIQYEEVVIENNIAIEQNPGKIYISLETHLAKQFGGI